MTKIRTLLERIVATLPARRKAQLVDIALPHLAELAYFRLANFGFCPKGIIDIGAYHGEWSRLVARIYPVMPIIMIEAQNEKKPYLEAACTEIPHATFEMALLGKTDGSEAVFNVMESGSSLYSERSNAPRTQLKLKMRTLDNVLKEYPQLALPLGNGTV
jgi:FkbM family methyltransferase